MLTDALVRRGLRPVLSWTVCAAPTRRAEVLLVAALVLVGGAFRCVALESFPTGIHVDEGGWGLFALALLRGEGPHPFGTAFLGESSSLTYLQAPFVALFGRTLTALRIVSAIAGTLTLVTVYALARALFGWRVAFVATAFLVGSAAHLHFSRISLNVVEVPLCASIGLLCLWRGHRTGHAIWWLLAGMATATGIYFNFGGQVLPFMLVLVMAYRLAVDVQAWRRWAVEAGPLALGGVMMLSPKLVYLSTRGQRLTSHGEAGLIFRNWDRVTSMYGTSDVAPILWEQIKRTVLGFITSPDAGPFYGFAHAPLLNELVAPFFMIGLVVLVARLRDFRYGLVFLWFWTTVLLASALTVGPPQFHRLLPALLPGVIAAAVGLDWLVGLVARQAGLSARPALAVLAAVALAASVMDAQAYFGPYARAYPHPESYGQVRYLTRLGSAYSVFVVASPYFDGKQANFRYLFHDAKIDELLNPSVQLEPPPLQRPLAFLVFEPRQDMLPLLQTLYPGGVLEPIEHPPGRFLSTAYLVPVEAARQPWPDDEGLTGTFSSERPGQSITGRVDRVISFRALVDLIPETSRPFRATWCGTLVAPRAGTYELELFTDGAASLQLGRQVRIEATPAPGPARSATQSVALDAGEHPIQIDYRWSSGPGVLEFRWQPPGEPRTVVPPSALRP